MKYFQLLVAFVAVIFLGLIQEGDAVLACYKCSSTTGGCQNIPNESKTEFTKVECKDEFPDNQNSAFLCESRVDGDTVTKRCILNNNESIDECDAMNEDKDSNGKYIESTKCYHCDREYCNSGTLLAVSPIVLTVLLVFRCIVN